MDTVEELEVLAKEARLFAKEKRAPLMEHPAHIAYVMSKVTGSPITMTVPEMNSTSLHWAVGVYVDGKQYLVDPAIDLYLEDAATVFPVEHSNIPRQSKSPVFEKRSEKVNQAGLAKLLDVQEENLLGVMAHMRYSTISGSDTSLSLEESEEIFVEYPLNVIDARQGVLTLINEVGQTYGITRKIFDIGTTYADKAVDTLHKAGVISGDLVRINDVVSGYSQGDFGFSEAYIIANKEVNPSTYDDMSMSFAVTVKPIRLGNHGPTFGLDYGHHGLMVAVEHVEPDTVAHLEKATDLIRDKLIYNNIEHSIHDGFVRHE